MKQKQRTKKKERGKKLAKNLISKCYARNACVHLERIVTREASCITDRCSGSKAAAATVVDIDAERNVVFRMGPSLSLYLSLPEEEGMHFLLTR